MSARTPTIIRAEPCFLTILILLSRNRTRGLAISAMTQPMTKGIKNPSSFGPQKHTR